MSHTYAANFFHCVFSTKEREHTIPGDLKPRLYAFIRGIANNLDVVPIAVGGTSDHVHLLLELRPNQKIAEVVQKTKANSSRWMNKHGLQFEWQKGYAVLTVSPSHVRTVCIYVQNQEQHHRKRSFEEEFISLLNKMGLRPRDEAAA